jgi:hypothetical protein
MNQSFRPQGTFETAFYSRMEPLSFSVPLALPHSSVSIAFFASSGSVGVAYAMAQS